ncbi:MAG: hypothetical protein ABFD53_09875, partial [Anaerolineaceae bacterium]
GVVLKEGCHLERSERSFHNYAKMSRCSFATLRTWLDMTFMIFYTASFFPQPPTVVTTLVVIFPKSKP